ncbi:sodium-dependent serotonin transporter-like isoform X2 [Tachypleus tridentatus]
MVALFFLGCPLLFLELTVGQYVSRGSAFLFSQLCPIAAGAGVVMQITVFMFCVLKNLFAAWNVYFLYLSFYPDTPWMKCDNQWNTQGCVALNHVPINISSLGNSSHVENELFQSVPRVPSSEEFFRNEVYEGYIGGNFFMLLIKISAITMIIPALCLIRGAWSLGKVLYLLVGVPVVALVVSAILLRHGLDLQGAHTGIENLFLPSWHVLGSQDVWLKTFRAVLGNVGGGLGIVIVLSSYRCQFKHNILVNLGETFLFCGFQAFFFLLSSVVLYSMAGHMSWKLNVKINDIIMHYFSYYGLVAALPTPLNHLVPLAASIYWLTIICVQSIALLGLVTAIVDATSVLQRKGYQGALVAFGLTVLVMACSLVGTREKGFHIINVFSMFPLMWLQHILLGLELALLAYFFLMKQFRADVPQWKGILVVVFFVFPPFILNIASAVDTHRMIEFLSVQESYVNPWLWIVGQVLLITLLSLIPLIAIFQVVFKYRHLPVTKRFIQLFRPTDLWYSSVLNNTPFGQEKYLDGYILQDPSYRVEHTNNEEPELLVSRL